MHPMMPCEWNTARLEPRNGWFKAFRTGELWPKASAHHIIQLQRSLGFVEPGTPETHHSELTLASTETVETIHVAENWSNHFLVHLSDIDWIYNLKSRFGWCPISIFFNQNLRSQELKKEAKESLNIKDGRMAKIIDDHRMSSQNIPTATVATGFGM